jgi:hypothetical protein
MCGSELGWIWRRGCRQNALLLAERFVRLLPEGFPAPEFAIEPDGLISLDWIRSPGQLVSLSIGRCERVAYAWLDGAEKGHGVADCEGSTIPANLAELIKRILLETSEER